MPGQEIADAILDVLRSSPEPLTTKAILRILATHPACNEVTKSDLDFVLYHLLKPTGRVELVPPTRWRIHQKSPSITMGDSATPIRQENGTPKGHTADDLPSLSASDLQSISAAIREEIAAAGENIRTEWIYIDAIESLPGNSTNFVYRLKLSSPLQLSADQSVRFETRKPKEVIQAVILRSDDEGLVVECQKPLLGDAQLLNLSFDPTFILRGLENVIQELSSSISPIARLVLAKEIPPSGAFKSKIYASLNSDQSRAVDEMDTTPLYFLWGPPGTGKTTTLGAAVVRWLRDRKCVLVVSTSNAAVDVAMEAILDRARPEERRHLLRLGASLNPKVSQLTIPGKILASNAIDRHGIMSARKRISEIANTLQMRTLSNERRSELFGELHRFETIISEFNARSSSEAQEHLSRAFVVGCTLANMVVDKTLISEYFDVVVLDEASMSSMIYSLAASFLAKTHLVYSGDPRQLPPIVQSDGSNAAKWFGQNVYDWFELASDDGLNSHKITMLETQYRMTTEIGGVVSRISYQSRLKHERGECGRRVQFIRIDSEWQSNHYSVSEKSYFHLSAIPILHAIVPSIESGNVLLLSPFRTQRSLLSAIGADLDESNRQLKISASTIHRAQGFESDTVILDLTTHSAADNLVRSYRDQSGENLFNVAISRAKDRLIIIGSQPILRKLSKIKPFWNRVVVELSTAIDSIDCVDILQPIQRFSELGDIQDMEAKATNAIFSHRNGFGTLKDGAELLGKIAGKRKLLVLEEVPEDLPKGDYIVRASKDSPTLFVGGGNVCLPYRGQWLTVRSPNACSVLWRIAFSHLADDEISVKQMMRFNCPQCSDGNLVLRYQKGEGWILVCSDGRQQSCRYIRRPTLDDIRTKTRLANLKCPSGHPMTAHPSKGGGYFLGCENYPQCDHTANVSLIAGH